jgi:hypothetical protein
LGDPLLIPVSAGELLDKKTILEIKQQRIGDPEKRANVERELQLLATIAQKLSLASEQSAVLAQLESELRAVNSELWDLENKVRACDRSGVFGDDFIASARQIYAGNDRRAAVKRRINLLLGSSIVEEKSHT